MPGMVAHTGIDHVATVGVAIAAVAVYGAGWLRSRDRTVIRLISWTVGIAAVGAATLPVTERAAERSFTGHMLQHLLLIVVAAPLLVVAHPIHTLFPRGPRAVRRFRHLTTTIARRSTIIAPLLFSATLIVTHLTGIYDATLHDRWVHDGEHVAYLLTGILLWATALGAVRATDLGRAGAALASGAAGALLSVIVISATTPLIPTYAERLGSSAAALADQRNAGTLMWISGMLTSVPLVIAAFWRWATREQQLARRREQLTDRPDTFAGRIDRSL